MKTGYKGVSRCPSSTLHPWKAQIHIDGKTTHLGCFATAEEAYAAWLESRKGLNLRRPRRVSAIGVYDDDRPWAEVELTEGRWAKVDKVDLGLVLGHLWRENNGYAVTGQWPNTVIRMHRLILGLADDDPREVDHVNGDRADNRRSNLRIASPAQNGANKAKRQRSSSRYKGVSWHKGQGKWMARICVGGRNQSLGSFATEQAAARAYNQAAPGVFGEFARLNDLTLIGREGRTPAA